VGGGEFEQLPLTDVQPGEVEHDWPTSGVWNG